MKNRRFFRMFLCSLLAAVSAEAVTVGTPPAGGFRLEAGGGRDTSLSLPLMRRSELMGRISAVGSATVTLNGAALTANAYAPTDTGSYQLQFVTGNLAGLSYKITGNTTTALTLETLGDNLSAHGLGAVVTGADGDLIRIRRAWTVGDVFGFGSGDLLLDRVLSASAVVYTKGDAVLLPDNQSLGLEKKSAATIVFVDGQGWRQLGDPLADRGATELVAGVPFVLRRQSGAAWSTIVVGYVAQEPGLNRLPALPPGGETDISAALVYPLNRRVADAGLVSAFESSLNAGAARDLLLIPSDTRTGFSLPAARRLHRVGATWYEGDTLADDQTLRLGSGFIIRLRGERPVRYWRQPGGN